MLGWSLRGQMFFAGESLTHFDKLFLLGVSRASARALTSHVPNEASGSTTLCSLTCFYAHHFRLCPNPHLK